MVIFTRKLSANILARLSRFWIWLVTPSVQIQKTDVLRQARLLATMLVVVTVSGVLSEILTIAFESTPDPIGHGLALMFFFWMVLAYLFNRNGRFIAAAWVTVAVLTAAIFSLTFYTGGLPVDASFLSFLFLPLLFASVFLPELMILALTGLFMAGMAFAALVFDMEMIPILLGPGSFITMAGGMIYLVFHHRNVLEADRQRDLVEREERYRMLFEGANDAIFLLNLSDTLIGANQKAVEMLGYAVDELIGKPASEVVAPREYPNMLVVKTALLAGQPIAAYERTFVRKDGSELPVEVNVSLLRDRENNPVSIQSIVRDITDRKRSEEYQQHQIERLNSLREIDRMITTSPDLQITLNVVLNHVTARLGVAAASILLFKSSFYHLEHFASHGYQSDAIQRGPLHLDDPLSGRAASERRLVSIPDLNGPKQSSHRLDALARQGFVTAFAVPLIAKDQVKGVLEVFHSQIFGPTPDWLDFLEMLGGQAAIAIDSAELFQNLQRSNLELIQSYDATLEGWARALELRDKETQGHSVNVTEMALRLGQAMGMDETSLIHLRRGALLHDIGKMGIPDEILFKPGPLNEDEWAIMKQHPVYAAEMLSSIPFLQQVIDIPYYHHERWDGSGYPLGLKGKNIPLAARIFMVVDIWDALISDRPYRKRWSREETLQYLRDQAGILLDPEIVEAFLTLIARDE